MRITFFNNIISSIYPQNKHCIKHLCIEIVDIYAGSNPSNLKQCLRLAKLIGLKLGIRINANIIIPIEMFDECQIHSIGLSHATFNQDLFNMNKFLTIESLIKFYQCVTKNIYVTIPSRDQEATLLHYGIKYAEIDPKLGSSIYFRKSHTNQHNRNIKIKKDVDLFYENKQNSSGNKTSPLASIAIIITISFSLWMALALIFIIYW